MSDIGDIVNKTTTGFLPADLAGLEKVKSFCFRACRSMGILGLPNTVKEIENDAFFACDQIQLLGLEVDPECLIGSSSATDATYGSLAAGNIAAHTLWWRTTQKEGNMVCVADGKILLGNKIVNPTGGYVIPETVINLASHSLQAYNTSYTLTEAVIPDHVEIVQKDVFNGHSLTKLTIGAGVRRMLKGLTSGSQAMTLIFRQPAGMAVELPTPGDGTGLCYNKDSRAYTIYTDNEAIRAYGWSTDNVTATFYSLAEAP